MSHRNCHTWINQVSCNGPINRHKHPFWSNHPKTRQWCVGVLLMISPILFVVFLGWNFFTKSTWSKIVNSIFLMSFLLEIPLFIKIEVQRGNKHASKIENNSPYVSMAILAIDIILIMWPSLHDLDVWVLIFELIVLISYIVYLFDYDKHLDNDEVKYNINDPYILVRKNEFNKIREGYYMKMSEDPREHITNEFNSRTNKDINNSLSSGVADSAIGRNASALVRSAVSSTNDSTSNLVSNVNSSTDTNLNNINTNDNYDYHADFKRTHHLLTEISNNDRDTFRSVVVLIVIFAIFVAVILFHIL